MVDIAAMAALPVQQHCQHSSSIASMAALMKALPVQQHCQLLVCTLQACLPLLQLCQHVIIAIMTALPAPQHCQHSRIAVTARLPAWHLCQQSSIASYLSSCPQRACFPYAIYTLREQNTIKSVSKELQGGPPLTQFSLPWVLLPWFLAYV